MSASDPVGEPSCKRQENGDATTSSDRPLKKARFAWQVKGKYHLKNDSGEVFSSANSYCDPDTPGTSTQNNPSTSDLIGNAEQNLEILGDYLLKQDFNTLDSVITDTSKGLLRPGASDNTEKIEYSNHQCSTEPDSRTLGPPSENVEILIAQIANSYNEDQCIARWQAIQQAKGCVDNTINRVLDPWMTAHIPTGIGDSRFLALDVAEFTNNLPGDNSIENEGILMAISAHGLQNNSSSSSDDDNSDSIDPVQENSETTQNNDNLGSEATSNLTRDFHMTWLYNDDPDDHSVSECFPNTSSSTYDQSLNPEVIAPGNDFMSHFDFMDAAVSFAIQNKGLTSYGTDYE